VQRREHEGPGAPVEGEQLLVRGVGPLVHLVLDAESGDALLKIAEVPWPSRSSHHQPDRKPTGGQREPLHEATEILVRHHVAHVEQVRLPIGLGRGLAGTKRCAS